jgi:hypothetical protein
MVGHQLAIYHVGQPALQTAQCFLARLAFGPFALVIGATIALRVADLDHGHDVQGVVDPAVARAGQAVTDLFA